MDDVTSIAGMRAAVAGWRGSGARIALVPTMGFLHEGHLTLVDRARAVADRVVVSSFVNPLQFGPSEDLDRYPRDPDRDRSLLEGRGTDVVYRPSRREMYPVPTTLRVDPGELGTLWEGAFRPGHFAGVLTVVAKLFNQVAPDVACFGRKDIQQVTLIRRMVAELDWPLDVVVVPTVREPDGLALSSRNVYLGPDERRDAVRLSRGLARAHAAFEAGERQADAIRTVVEAELASCPAIRVDYIAVADPETLRPATMVTADTVVALAARLGTTRLIDNIRLGAGLDGIS